MSKAICSISGVPITVSTVEDIPCNLPYTPGFNHPIFYLPQQKLISLYNLHCLHKTNQTTSYLTYLAILNSSGLVEYETNFIYTPEVPAIISKTITSLFLTVSKISTLSHTQKHKFFPSYRVTKNNNSLEGIGGLLESWNSVIEDFSSSYELQKKNKSLHSIEERLHNFIYDRKHPQFYQLLGEWAEVTCEFPTFTILTSSQERIPINSYWKSLIRKACRGESLIAIPASDLTELYEHCLTSLNIEEDFSGYGEILLEILKKASTFTDEMFGFSIVPPEVSITGGVKEISITEINLESLRKEEEKPTRLKYPNLPDFVAALSRWLVQQHSQNIPTSSQK